MRVYLDNAASTPMDSEVLQHILPYFSEFHGNPSSVHSHGRKLRTAIERSRKDIARLLGASPAEIFFTSGGTEADNMAIKGSVCGLGLTHIITSKVEHHAVSHPIEEFEKEGKVTVTWLDVDSKGNINHEELDAALANNPRSLVSLMHANNEIGTLLDIKAVGDICKKHDAIFHSDTVQAMGNLEYNLSELNVHFVTASAHKFYGPKGVGFLYIDSSIKIPSLICGGSQERNMRAGTENITSIVGMSFALEKCIANLEKKNDTLWQLKTYMKEALKDHFPGVQFNGETGRGNSIPTVLNVAFPIQEQESMLLFNLDIQGISASGGSACTSGSVKGSHVLQGIGCEPSRAVNSVRFSFGIQNTIEEIDYVVSVLRKLIKVPVNA